MNSVEYVTKLLLLEMANDCSIPGVLALVSQRRGHAMGWEKKRVEGLGHLGAGGIRSQGGKRQGCVALVHSGI